MIWDLFCYSDNDYMGDPDSRRNILVYILYTKNVPISWWSKAQRSVTLSSSEAAYIVLSEAEKKIIFVVQLMESMGVKVEYSIIVWVNNVGAIFMSNNMTTSNCIKHMDISNVLNMMSSRLFLLRVKTMTKTS